MMRRPFRHGASHCNNQFGVRSDKHEETIVAGRQVVTIRIARRYGEAIHLTTNSNGKDVHPRTIAYQAAHTVVDQAATVASEDLTLPIKGKGQWRRDNRRMSSWAKGVLARALEEVCSQRGAAPVTVNAAYTSQMDSFSGLLEGKRVSDKFYRETGDVIQADFNAARNVLARLHDQDIERWTPHADVRRIPLARSSGATERQEAPVGRRSSRSPRQRSADKSNARLRARKLEQAA